MALQIWTDCSLMSHIGRLGFIFYIPLAIVLGRVTYLPQILLLPNLVFR